MRSVIAAVLVPVIVVVLIGPYTFLPSLLEYAVATDVQNRLGIEKQPEVRLKSDPPLAMLEGEFSGGRIAMRNVDLGGVRAERASIDLDPFDIDVWDTMKNGRVVARKPLSGALQIEVSGEEVARLAEKSSAGTGQERGRSERRGGHRVRGQDTRRAMFPSPCKGTWTCATTPSSSSRKVLRPQGSPCPMSSPTG